MNEDRQVILITGSSGRIGTRLTERLHRKYRVIGFDHQPSNCALEVADCVTVDLRSESSVQQAMEYVRSCYGSRIASVVHLAAYYDFYGKKSPLYDEVNVRGTWRLVRGLREFTVEQFLFASTMLVHQPTEPGEPICEASPLASSTDWGYPRSKMEAERLLRGHRGEMPLVIARLAAVYDEYCRLIPLARHIQRIYERQMTGHLFAGNPLHGMTYLHYDDLTDALVRIIERRSQLPQETVLLVGEKEPVSYQELQDELGRRIHGREWETQVVPPVVARAGAWIQEHLPAKREPFIKPWMIDRADDHYELDTQRAHAYLDWQPERRLLQTLPDMVSVLFHDPRRWYATNELELPEWLLDDPRKAA